MKSSIFVRLNAYLSSLLHGTVGCSRKKKISSIELSQFLYILLRHCNNITIYKQATNYSLKDATVFLKTKSFI